MPYPRAHYYVLLVIAVTVAGFWASYFSTIGHVPWQFHAHGLAASIWVLLVLTQSWTAHRRMFAWHGAAGRASLFLFPFLIGGLTAIIDLTSKGFLAGDDPVRMLDGGSFLIGIVVAVAAYVTLFYQALSQRRNYWAHAGYMLATPLILWESPFSRLLTDYMPGLIVRGPQDFANILASIEWAMATAVAFCLVVRWRVGKRGQPFVVAALFIVAEMAAMGWLGNLGVARSALAFVGHLPSALVVATGFAIGALTSWAGWNAGKRATKATPAAMPQAA